MEFLWWATGACLLVSNQYVECIKLIIFNMQNWKISKAYFFFLTLDTPLQKTGFVARIFNGGDVYLKNREPMINV